MKMTKVGKCVVFEDDSNRVVVEMSNKFPELLMLSFADGILDVYVKTIAEALTVICQWFPDLHRTISWSVAFDALYDIKYQ